MNQKRQQILEKIVQERLRQFNLPGSEFDITRSPNDWLAIVGRYLYNSSSTKNIKSTKQDFEDDLTKAAAVILAALENVDRMTDNNQLRN